MTERHHGQMALRTAPATSGHHVPSRTGRPQNQLTWREARNGLPPSAPYEWKGQPDLSGLRQAAAARCGLSEYPAELIGLSESLDRGWGHLPQRERDRIAKRYRRLALAARREGGAALSAEEET